MPVRTYIKGAESPEKKIRWDLRFWQLAKHISKWSKDPNAKVGAIITLPRGGAIALGYNGLPMRVQDSEDRLNDQQLKLDMVVHAEINALLIAGQGARGGTLYVTGKSVCSRCAGVIIQAGVSRVVAEDPSLLDKKSKWRKGGELALTMFREADVTVAFMK